MPLKLWDVSVDFNTPAGRVLRQLAAALPRNRNFRIIVFGSAPLQMMVDPRLASADVDIISADEEVGKVLRKAGLAEGQSEIFVQLSDELTFQTSPRWKDRTTEAKVDVCTFIFPHPMDILIAKLNRLEEKDINAFQAVRAKGRLTEAELIEELGAAVDLFRPNFDEERSADFGANTRRLWPILFGREINPAQEIIAPALAKRRAGYGEAGGDFKQELREAAKGYSPGEKG